MGAGWVSPGDETAAAPVEAPGAESRGPSRGCSSQASLAGRSTRLLEFDPASECQGSQSSSSVAPGSCAGAGAGPAPLLLSGASALTPDESVDADIVRLAVFPVSRARPSTCGVELALPSNAASRRAAAAWAAALRAAERAWRFPPRFRLPERLGVDARVGDPSVDDPVRDLAEAALEGAPSAGHADLSIGPHPPQSVTFRTGGAGFLWCPAAFYSAPWRRTAVQLQSSVPALFAWLAAVGSPRRRACRPGQVGASYESLMGHRFGPRHV